MPEPSARAIYQTPWLSARSPCRWEATSASEMCRSICLKSLFFFFLEYQAIFPLRWLVVGFGSFFQKQNVYLEFDGGEGKKTMRLWFSEKWNAQLLWKESDLNTLFILSKLPPRNRKHVFFLPFSEIWLMFIQFKLNLGKSVASAVFFFWCVVDVVVVFRASRLSSQGRLNQHLFVRIQILLCPTDRTEGDYDVSLVQFMSQLHCTSRNPLASMHSFLSTPVELPAWSFET